jgi:polar amino acid transport system substrate-binding protein
VAIFGALTVGLSFAMMHAWLSRWGIIGWVFLLPQKVLITVARMTPPILQLYIVYFGLGGTLTERFNFTPSNFLIAAVILSLYAGATNAVILVNAMSQELRASPKSGPLQLLPRAITRAFDGLVASCVNIVKAAGMASAIAVTEVISTINLLVAEGANTATFMNGLLVFYFFLVLAIIWIFKLVRRALVEQT